METIREFIEEAVVVYNAGKLTPRKLIEIRDSYKITFEGEYWDRCRNLKEAESMLWAAFKEQKGEKITKKLDFEWSEAKKYPNPFYEPTD